MISYRQFLSTKPLFYDHVDLSRMPEAYAYVAPNIKVGHVVHIVGTNGKGTTGRMLAMLLHADGECVGHYTSPHILRFNERIWIDGEEAGDALLEEAHWRLQRWLPSETSWKLSYFEYTTLLALVAFEGCDTIVLEAGLGGEFDATNVVDKRLSVVTPIGLDHQAFLGESIEEIAATKLRSIEKRALLAKQPDPRVYEVAECVAQERGSTLFHVEACLKDEEKAAIRDLSEVCGWPSFLHQNAETAVAAYRLFKKGPLPLGALREFRMRGRFESIGTRVIVDVGHNVLGAQAIVRALKGRKRVLVYNALSDKDVASVLEVLKPVIKRLEIIDIRSDRVMERKRLEEIVNQLEIPMTNFEEIEDEDYLVFGSFYVVESFLKRYNEINE